MMEFKLKSMASNAITKPKIYKKKEEIKEFNTTHGSLLRNLKIAI